VLRAGRQVGRVTSGGFAPTLGAPVALALIDTPAAETGAALELLVRGKARPAILVETPFVPHRYAREATR
jgi:aminomethyltransferase